MEQSRELETTRKRLAGRTGARDEARKALDLAIGDELAPAWVGTKWTFSGRATRPYGGTVACGHYIGAVLRGAGLQVSSEVGALASARIVRTFAGKSRTRWRTDQGVQRVVEEVRREGTGLYLLGLDTHVGMLRVRGRAVDLCHSTGSWPRAVVCEDALASPSMRSRVHVWGPLLTDETVDAWLAGRRIPLAP
ncbi:MAG: hypothetical protein KDA24_06755 [Deltaproteobacteria bacterium]|nr:hypothetical protein [Deltaproteobacteria bacterium]